MTSSRSYRGQGISGVRSLTGNAPSAPRVAALSRSILPRPNKGRPDVLSAIGDPAHTEHEALTEWVGGAFDPHVPNADELRLDVLTHVKNVETAKAGGGVAGRLRSGLLLVTLAMGASSVAGFSTAKMAHQGCRGHLLHCLH